MLGREINLMFVLSTFAAIILFGNGISVLVTDYKNPVKRLYFMLMSLFVMWNITNMIMNATRSIETALLLRNIAVFFCNLTYPTVFVFYTLLSESVTPLKKLPRIAITFAYLLAIGYTAIIFFVSPYTANSIYLTRWGWAYVISNLQLAPERFYYFFITPFIIVMLFYSFRVLNNGKNKRLLIFYQLISLGIAATFLASLFTDVIMPLVKTYHILPLAAIFPVAPAMLAVYSIYHFNYFSINSLPIIKGVVDANSDAIIVTDSLDKVAYLNDTARQLFNSLDIDDRFSDDINFSNFNSEEKSMNINRQEQQLVLSAINSENTRYYKYEKRILSDKFNQAYACYYIFDNITESVNNKNSIIIANNELENKINARTQNLMHKAKILDTYNRQLKRELEHRQKMESKIRELAYHDVLTGLNNRTSFVKHLDTLFEETISSATHAIVFLDIVDFKTINDNLGRKFGDNVLITLADTLREQFEDHTVLARLASDRFAILFKNCHDKDEISDKIVKLFEVLSVARPYDNLTLSIYFTAGIAFFPVHGNSAEKLINYAEIACRRAKKLGKNKFLSFRPEFKHELHNRFRAINALKNAIANNELAIYYQPQIRMQGKDYHIIGLEALVRWQHDGQILVPSDFINVAEYSKQIVEIGEHVIDQAIADISKVNSEYNLELSLAINISAVQMADDSLYWTIKNKLEQYNFNPKLLELELTESVLVSQVALATSRLGELINLGVKITVDDFGIEYSSLNYLKILPIDKIKLDISFVKGIGVNRRDETILEAMITLAKRLSLNIVAEGIETDEQIKFLTNMDCNDLQGFYFYKPMTLDDLLTEINSDKN